MTRTAASRARAWQCAASDPEVVEHLRTHGAVAGPPRTTAAGLASAVSTPPAAGTPPVAAHPQQHQRAVIDGAHRQRNVLGLGEVLAGAPQLEQPLRVVHEQ